MICSSEKSSQFSRQQCQKCKNKRLILIFLNTAGFHSLNLYPHLLEGNQNACDIFPCYENQEQHRNMQCNIFNNVRHKNSANWKGKWFEEQITRIQNDWENYNVVVLRKNRQTTESEGSNVTEGLFISTIVLLHKLTSHVNNFNFNFFLNLEVNSLVLHKQ